MSAPAKKHNFTAEEVEEYRSAFKLFDKDGDGTITAEELGTVMRKLNQNPSDTELEDMVNEVDHDRNGSIDFDEFLQLMSMKTAALDAGDEIRNAFDVFDKDGDGYIDAQELREIMHSLGEEMNEDELNEMLNQADKNGDGKICFDEFKDLMTKS